MCAKIRSKPKLVEHLQLLKDLEAKGISFRIKGDTLFAVNPSFLTDEDIEAIRRMKPLLIEAIRDREMIFDLLYWNASHATDHSQLGLFVDQAQINFELGQLSMEQTIAVAQQIQERAKAVPSYTGTEAVVFVSKEEIDRRFPKRKEWKA